MVHRAVRPGLVLAAELLAKLADGWLTVYTMPLAPSFSSNFRRFTSTADLCSCVCPQQVRQPAGQIVSFSHDSAWQILFSTSFSFSSSESFRRSPLSCEKLSCFSRASEEGSYKKNLKSCFDQGYAIRHRRINEHIHLQGQDASIVGCQNDNR